MTMTENRQIPPSAYVSMTLAFLASMPGIYFGFQHGALSPMAGSIIFGVAILGAAFLLSWAAEAAQIEISQSLAIAILALVAVLPEYAVDFVFTWKAAHDPTQAHYAIANMTGANRLLIGLGWPLILFLAIIIRKQKSILLDESQRIEIFYLGMATLYSFTIPLKGNINLIDTVILVTLFAFYARRASQMETVDPQLEGPTLLIAALNKTKRRLMTGFLFLFAGVAIFAVAEPFAESLVTYATILGWDPFHAVQWLAPIASEAPEFIIASVWASRGAANVAIRALISSKVNQWTLLIGTIPLVYAISAGEIKAFPLDQLQKNELILTAAQSLFGVAVLINLRFVGTKGLLLVSLFLLQLFIDSIRMEVSIVYGILSIIYLIINRSSIVSTYKTGLGLNDNST